MKKLIQLAIALLVIPASALAGPSPVTFDMLVSAGARECTPNARGTVTIVPVGHLEHMHVSVSGLPPNTEFEFFVIQLPNAPWGMSWYQGRIDTNHLGQGSQTFVGTFSGETFTVAPGTGPAPLVHVAPIRDAVFNPQMGPVHMYHLGLWFGSHEAAAAAGCPNALTPFDGEHNAGIQVLNTRNFPDDRGPLGEVTSP
jgi:hypothetical protein